MQNFLYLPIDKRLQKCYNYIKRIYNLSPPNIFKKGMTINKKKKVNYKIFTNNYISCYLHWLIDLLVSKMRKR